MTEQKAFAFTLSEVLIVLAVLGVVAAMTIPDLVQDYQKKATATALKKVYSVLNQAVDMAVAEHGDVQSWSSANQAILFDEYLKEHLSIIKINKLSENLKVVKYKEMDRYAVVRLAMFNYPSKTVVYTLSSGTQFFVYPSTLTSSSQIMCGFVVDINGYKTPNIFGKDLFYMYLLSTGEIMLAQADDREDKLTTRRTREQLLNGPSAQSYQCNKSGRGEWCGALIQKDGWEIADDYPW